MQKNDLSFVQMKHCVLLNLLICIQNSLGKEANWKESIYYQNLHEVPFEIWWIYQSGIYESLGNLNWFSWNLYILGNILDCHIHINFLPVSWISRLWKVEAWQSLMLTRPNEKEKEKAMQCQKRPQILIKAKQCHIMPLKVNIGKNWYATNVTIDLKVMTIFKYIFALYSISLRIFFVPFGTLFVWFATTFVYQQHFRNVFCAN